MILGQSQFNFTSTSLLELNLAKREELRISAQHRKLRRIEDCTTDYIRKHTGVDNPNTDYKDTQRTTQAMSPAQIED